MNSTNVKILLYCHHTLSSQTRSGIQRVVVESARALATCVSVDLVKWDELDGQLRYLSEEEIVRLFGDCRPEKIAANQYCARVNYRFGDTLAEPASTWLLFPEIPYHQDKGNAIFARILSQTKTYGIQTACIFYDLIPVRDPDYADSKKIHLEYLLEILRCDRIFPISRFAGKDLLDFYDTVLPADQVAALVRSVVPVPLGSREAPAKIILDTVHREKRIVLLGTVEPRKQQTRFLRVFNDLLLTETSLSNYSIDIFGSLHPASANELYREIGRNSKIAYHRYSADEEISKTLSQSSFSVFISRSEGYGLPIVESIRLGIPCMTSSFDAMSEVADGGGCLQVDSLSDKAISDGILKLVHQPETLTQLRTQARARRLRTWNEYACDLVKNTPCATGIFSTDEIIASLRVGAGSSGTVVIGGVFWRVMQASNLNAGEAPKRQNDHCALVVLDWSLDELNSADDEALIALCDADVLAFEDERVLRAFPTRLRARDIQRLPTARVGVLSSSGLKDQWVVRAVAELSLHRCRLHAMAEKENMLVGCARALADELPESQHQLSIVISTYNRAAFCELNVSWLLSKLRKYGGRAHLVVVDNASTDNTVERLSVFQADSNFTLIVNSSNLGMLGNLRACSTLQVARHVWLIGDDDFIHDHAIESVMALIEANPRIPLISTNFSVYYRQSVVDGDNGERYILEGRQVASKAPPNGLIDVIGVTKFHDNIFTAIYPLIFRADLMAACFNYMFDGEPFQNLVESVPTTKFVLEYLALCQCYWLGKPGITGNAHNSWTKYRPRWHSVLIPEILQLARDSGMPADTGWRWMHIHGQLFDEAVEQADASGIQVNLSKTEISYAAWLFRRSMFLPETISIYEQGQPPLFSRK